MIKAVYFDIDNTLCNYDKANNAAMEKLYQFGVKQFSLNPDEMNHLLSEAQKAVQKRLGEGSAAIHDRLIRFQCFLELLHDTDFQKAAWMNRIYWDTFMDTITPEPGIVRLLQELKKAGVLLGIGSDQSSHIQYRKLETLGILTYFSRIVTSEEAGAEKPAAKFFQLCVKKAGCNAKECVFIGDHVQKDAEGALQNGLYGILYCPGQYGRQKHGYSIIHSYADCLKEDGIQLGEIMVEKLKIPK